MAKEVGKIDLKALVDSVPDSTTHKVYLDMFATSQGRVNSVNDRSYTTCASSHLEISDLIFPELG